MPVYEFYCDDCNIIFNFYSKTVNTSKKPNCPKCKVKKLTRQMSVFSVTGNTTKNNDMDNMPIDGDKMEQAMQMLAGEADKTNKNDPRQAANLMRKLSNMTGLELGSGMNEALDRMEKGEDPEQIEADMGDSLESEELFILPDKRGKGGKTKRPAPKKDEILYDL